MAVYYGYLLSGIPEGLWAKGVWFSANDVLHLGLIAWMVYIYAAVRPHVSTLDIPRPRVLHWESRHLHEDPTK